MRNKTSAQKEVDAIRKYADMLESDGYPYAANYMRLRADEIAPPKPDIPDGFVWFRADDDHWRMGIKQGDRVAEYGGRWEERSLNEIRPVRALKLGQVAADREVLSFVKRMLLRLDAVKAAEQVQAMLDNDPEAHQ